jgi:hypothetical protein
MGEQGTEMALWLYAALVAEYTYSASLPVCYATLARQNGIIYITRKPP